MAQLRTAERLAQGSHVSRQDRRAAAGPAFALLKRLFEAVKQSGNRWLFGSRGEIRPGICRGGGFRGFWRFQSLVGRKRIEDKLVAGVER